MTTRAEIFVVIYQWLLTFTPTSGYFLAQGFLLESASSEVANVLLHPPPPSSHGSVGLRACSRLVSGGGVTDKINIKPHHPGAHGLDPHHHQNIMNLFISVLNLRGEEEVSNCSHLTSPLPSRPSLPSIISQWVWSFEYWIQASVRLPCWPSLTPGYISNPQLSVPRTEVPQCPRSQVWLTQSISQANTDWQVRILAPTTQR